MSEKLGILRNGTELDRAEGDEPKVELEQKGSRPKQWRYRPDPA
jgi:hypothetical protein